MYSVLKTIPRERILCRNSFQCTLLFVNIHKLGLTEASLLVLVLLLPLESLIHAS